jgi:MarR family transcriptional regulator, organic hydroperoxide resistance regulator
MTLPVTASELPTDVLLALDNQVCFALHAAARSMQRAYQTVLGPLDLTYSQYLVMLVVWEWDRLGQPRPTLTALGTRLDLDSGTLTPLVRRLEQKGLLTRKRQTDDARELFVRLTAAGRALKERARSVPLALLACAPLPLDELLVLRDQLQRLRSSLASPATVATLATPTQPAVSP